MLNLFYKILTDKKLWSALLLSGLSVRALAQIDDQYIYAQPVAIYTVNGGDYISATSVNELKQNINAQQELQFDKCKQATSYSCVKSVIISVTPAPGFNSINGIPIFQLLNFESHYESKSPPPNSQTSSSIQNVGAALGAVLSLSCPAPFSGTNEGQAPNFTSKCAYLKPKACPTTGNPINLGTAEKVENEIDFSTADHLLKVERKYINQFSGWVVDEPNKLLSVPASSTVSEPRFSSNQQTSEISPLIMLKRYKLDAANPSATELIPYAPPMFYINILPKRVVYFSIGLERYRFVENNNVFVGDGLVGLKTKLTEFSSVDSQGAKWKLTDQDNNNLFLLPNGNLQRKEFASGERITQEYNGNQLISKTDHLGRRISYAYDSYGRLNDITLPDGQVIHYNYGSDPKASDFNLLKKVTWPNEESVSYTYNESGMIDSATSTNKALTGKFDSGGNRTGTYKYSGNQAISTEGALGSSKRTLQFFGNYTSNTTGLDTKYLYYFNTTLPDGAKLLTGTNQPAGSGCAASTQSATYYNNGLKKTETDFNGNKTQYEYLHGRALETIRVEGVAANSSADYTGAGTTLPTGVRKTTTEWHSNWRKPVKKAEARLLTTYIYNGDADPFNGGQIAQCSTANLPLLCHQVEQATTDVNGSAGLSASLDSSVSKRELSYTYNARGQLTSRARALNSAALETREYYETTTSDYRAGDLKSITNALGHKTQFTRYDTNGRLLTSIDANNVSNQFTYDVRGRLTSHILGTSTTTHKYDLNGNRVESILPNGVVVTYQYDAAKRLTFIRNALGDAINYEYDVENNLRFERVTNASGSLTYMKEHIYDALGRAQNIVDTQNKQTTFLYDANGNPTGVTNPKQHSTSHQFDALDQLKQTTDALSGKTEYSYDAQGNIKAVKDPRGNSTSYVYNAFGDLTSLVSPDTGTTTFTYDTAGNRLSATDARSVVVNYTYDALNRLKTVTYPASSSENITYTYDSTANSSYGIGRLSSIATGSTLNDYVYNYQGLIVKKFTQVDSTLSTTQYSYDTAGNLSTITYPSGRLITYTRNAAGRIQSITTKANATATSQSIASAITYLPFGPVASYTYGNGLTHTNTFDTDYRLTAIQVGGVLSRGYTYDLADNITGISDGRAASKNQTLGYDALDRLTSAQGIYGTLGYTYDEVGNRLSETSGGTTATYTYETTNNRLSSIAKTNANRSFLYDVAGNRIKGTSDGLKVQDYTYNNANRLSTVKETNSLVATYKYNALGQRVSKLLASQVQELYHYDEAGHLIAVTDAAGNTTREYIYSGNELLGFIAGQSTAIPTTTITATTNQATLQNAVLATTYSGYTGTAGYIQFNGEGQASWPVTIAATANHTIQVSYALASGTRAMDVYVDGVKKTTVSFASTTAWTKWTATGVTLNLTAGNHTLMLKTTGASGPNLDRVRLTPVAGQTTGTASVYYVHNDHKSTPQVVTAQNQSVVWMADYQPFGKLQPNQSNSLELYSRFPGQYVDNETGIYYNYFRDYDPSIGRYIESDPIGLAGGINTYAYVEGNPASYVDPTGENPLIGALTGAGIDIALQLMGNGGRLECIKWDVVAIAAVGGAFNPFSSLSGLGTVMKGQRQAARAANLKLGSRAAKRTGQRADKHHYNGAKELASWALVEGGAEGLGNLIPEDKHWQLNNDECEPCK